MKKCLVIFLITISILAPKLFADKIYLSDGSVISGSVSAGSQKKYLIKTNTGLITIERSKILYIDFTDKLKLNQTNIYVQQQQTLGVGLRDDKALRKKIESMLASRAFLDDAQRNKLIDYSAVLNLKEKMIYYSMYRKDHFFGYTLMNAFVPSLGSWIQNDYVGAIITDFLGFTGASLVIASLPTFFNTEVNNVRMTLGVVSLIASGFFNLTRPYYFEISFNKKLKSALVIPY